MDDTRRMARSHDLVIEPLGDGAVVFDRHTDEIHHLNASAYAVWRRCDGTRTVAQIAEEVAAELAIAVPDEAVHQAFAHLDGAGLLEATATPDRTGMTRRQLLVRMGIAAAAAPVVTSIVAPSPAAALTCGQTCRLNSGINCPGETTIGPGNCRCNASSGNGTCIPCVPTGGGFPSGQSRLCCSTVGTFGTCA